jgi:lysozyme
VLRALVAQVATDTGKTPMIYTGAWFWDGGTYLAGTVTLPSNPLWVSGYTTGCVTVPTGWTDWHIWQYSDGTCAGCPVAGTPVPGVASSPSVDRDRWNGTLASLQAFANGSGGGSQWGGQFVSQSFPYASVGTIQIHAGQSQAVTLTMRNIGTHAWDGSTRIGTTQPRDRSDPFVGAGWIGPNRPAGLPAGMSIPMGGMYAFQWTFYVPATMAPGRYTEYFGMVEEGVAWFSDPGQAGPPDNQLEAIVEVLPPVTPPPDAGPMPDASSGDAGHTDASTGDVVHSDAASGDSAPSDASHGEAGVARDGGDAGGDAGNTQTMGGCGCRTAGRSRATDVAGLVLVALVALAGRRRRG